MLVKRKYEPIVNPYDIEINYDEIYAKDLERLIESFTYAMKNNLRFYTIACSDTEDPDKWEHGVFRTSTENIVGKQSDFDYISDDETCPDVICENPRFAVDWEHPENMEPILVETGQPILNIDSNLVAKLAVNSEYVIDLRKMEGENLNSVGRAIAQQIKEQDNSKYKAWSEDMTRFRNTSK